MGNVRALDSTTTVNRSEATTESAEVARTRPATESRVHGAEITREFGLSTTALPDLLGDWQDATVKAAIRDAADATYWHLVDAAAEQHRVSLGVERLRWRDYNRVAKPFIEQYRQPAVDRLTPQMSGTAARTRSTFDAAVAAFRRDHSAGLLQLKDPFTPLIRNDPQARAQENVLWENNKVIVIQDAFAEERGSGPKMLVIPKAALSLPADASAALLGEMARVAQAAAEAMAAAGNSTKSAGIWINPPQRLSVSQLHVHVSSRQTPWKKRADENNWTPSTLRGQMTRFYNQVRTQLAQRLGPSS